MAACDNVEQGHITQLLGKIKPAIAAETTTQSGRNGQNEQFVNNVTQLNVANTLQHIYHESSILRLMIDQEDIGMVGAIYDVSTGEVSFRDFSTSIELVSELEEPLLAEKLQKVMHSAQHHSNNSEQS